MIPFLRQPPKSVPQLEDYFITTNDVIVVHLSLS